MTRQLAVFNFAVFFLLACTANTVGTPSASSATTRGPSPTPMPTAVAISTPTASPSPQVLTRGIAVVRVKNLNLRSAPGTAEPIETTAPGGPGSGDAIRLEANQAVWILGSREVNGAAWYRIVSDYSFLTGWVSAGPDRDWLAPFDRSSCPAAANEAVDNGFIRNKPLLALACFDGDQLAVIAYWPTPAQSGADVPCPWAGDAANKWLVCYEFVNKLGDGTRSLPIYGTTGLRSFERGRWWTVLGHFDDPRARDCPESTGTGASNAEATVLFCRTRFVVDSLGSPPVP